MLMGDQQPKPKSGVETDVLVEPGQRTPNRSIVLRLSRWLYYDVAFGLVLPVACFVLEFVLLPALGWLPGLIFFHRYRIFGYGVVALEIATLAAWLRFGRHFGRWYPRWPGCSLPVRCSPGPRPGAATVRNPLECLFWASVC